jgi:hypothetical protein
MNSEQSLAAVEATDASSQTQTSQDMSATQGRVYSQQEFDDAMAKMKAAVSKKVQKQYEDLGDVEELRNIKSEFERKRQEEQVKRGEFEKILQDLASKKDQEIARKDSVIREYKVDTPLLNVAAQMRSVNPQQVKSLLKNNVRLGGDGEVEVVDDNGQVRYGDAGTPLGVQDLVREFLEANPHFVQPTPSTTNSKSSIAGSTNGKLDLSKLDMNNPDHRKVYAEYRKTSGLAR